MDRAERRKLRRLKIKQREEVVKISGFRKGTMYEKHINKIKTKGPGYMSKHGTLLHYAYGYSRTHGKVRDRSSWEGTENWKPRDIRQMDYMNDMEKELDQENI